MSNTPEQMQGAPTTTSDVSANQLPESSSSAQPSLFQQAMQGAVQPAPTQQPTPANPQSGPTQQPDPRDSHPMVRGASLIRRAGEVLAGGKPYDLVIDPATGESKRVPKELDTKHLLLGALSNILGGIGTVSGNLSARMQSRAPQPIGPLPTQQAQQQRDTMSEDEVSRRENAKVRQAKILNANLESLRLSYALRHEEDASLDQVISNHKDDLDNWNKAGAVEASNIPSSELLQKGYDKSRYLAIPDSRIPVYDKNTGQRVISKEGIPVSELGYSIVDGTTQAPLSQDKYDQLARYSLMTGKEGFKVPEGGTISSAQLALLNSKLGLIQQSQRELDEVHDTVGAPKVDLAAEIKKNKGVLTALEQFHNGSATEDNPVQQIAAMAASNNPKAKNAVGVITNLFGAENLKAFAQKQAGTDFKNVDDARKKLADDAQNVKVNPDGTVNYTGKDSGIQDAANFLNLSVKQETAQKVNQKKSEKAAGVDEDNSQPVADAFGVQITPASGGAKGASKIRATFKKDADGLAQTEGTYNQFSSIKKDIDAGKDLTGAQSVVALFNAIGISAEPLKGKGFRINNNTVEEHATARGLGESLYQKLLKLKNGDVITPQQIKDYADIATQARHDAYINKINEARNQGLDPTFLLPRGNGRQLDPSTAQIYLDAADGNKDAARKVAASQGWKL